MNAGEITAASRAEASSSTVRAAAKEGSLRRSKSFNDFQHRTSSRRTYKQISGGRGRSRESVEQK
jgi:hypothetical protein